MKKDRNGYYPSIMGTESGACYVCGKHTDTARHEIFYGTANRKISKNEGLWIDVCPDCHAKLHSQGGNTQLKQLAELKWIRENGTSEEAFIQLFGRSYL